jgi:hypothetical protein
MAPVGSYESLMAAVQGGAGSVYFGVGQLNMRSRSASNFAIEDLPEISRICRKHGLRSYLTLNTVVFDHEHAEARSIIDAVKEKKSAPSSPQIHPLFSMPVHKMWRCICQPRQTSPILKRYASGPILQM